MLSPSRENMRVLVQRSDTGQFYGTDVWVRDSDLAQNFNGGKAAEEFCATLPVTDLRIIFKFPADANRPDVVLPIRLTKDGDTSDASSPPLS